MRGGRVHWKIHLLAKDRRFIRKNWKIFFCVGTYFLLCVLVVRSSNSTWSISIPSGVSKPIVLLTAENSGRLGNQMFLYAGLFAMASENHRISYMSPRMSGHLSKHFNLSMPALNESTFKSVDWRLKVLHTDPINLIIDYEDRSKNVRLIEHPEHWRYFDKIRATIQNEFEFKREIQERAMERIRNVTKDFTNTSTVIVGVHVRLTDFIKHARKYWISVPEIEFYVGAMNYFRLKYENVVFLVLSDNYEWCRSNFENLTALRIHYMNSTYQQFENPGEDLAVLANCDHVIYGIGTFGFWGAYLGGHDAIYCSDCYMPTSFLWKYFANYGKNVLPTWIGFTRSGVQSSLASKWTGRMGVSAFLDEFVLIFIIFIIYLARKMFRTRNNFR